MGRTSGCVFLAKRTSIAFSFFFASLQTSLKDYRPHPRTKNDDMRNNVLLEISILHKGLHSVRTNQQRVGGIYGRFGSLDEVWTQPHAFSSRDVCRLRHSEDDERVTDQKSDTKFKINSSVFSCWFVSLCLQKYLVDSYRCSVLFYA